MACGIFKLLIRTLKHENVEFTLTTGKILALSQNFLKIRNGEASGLPVHSLPQLS